MGLWASRPRPEGVISPSTHTPAPPGPTEAGAATPGPQSSTDHAPAHSSQTSAPPAAPSSAPNPQPCGPPTTTQDSADGSAGPAISLAAALLGLPAAPGHYSPPDKVPGPWVDLFLEKHADREVFAGLFSASRSTQQWCLQHASDATLSFELSSVEFPDVWQGRLAAARAALTARGRLPTRLSVLVLEGPANDCILASMPSFLWQAGQGITRLELDVYGKGAMELGTLFVRCLAPSVPNLTTLTLGINPCTLPPPQSLPHLTKLTMRKVAQECCASIAPYLTQLTSLQIDPHHDLDEPEFFTGLITTSTTTLTRFSTDACLGDELLGLLLTHTPALTDLRVGPVTVQSDTHSGKQWGVKKLRPTAYDHHNLDTAIEMWELPYLPTCATGTLMCVKDLELDVSTDEGLDEDVLACLSSWKFQTEHVSVIASDSLSDVDHHIALTNTLQQLTALKATGARVELFSWEWTSAMAETLCIAAPDLANLKLGVHVDTLTDELLGVVLLMGPHMRRLSVGQLDLHSDQHADKAWPWSVVYITQCDIASLVRMPHPRGSGAPRKVLCRKLKVDKGAISEAMFHRVTDWLFHTTWAPITDVDSEEKVTISLHCCEGEDSSASLRRQLDLLRYIRLAEPDERVAVVKLVSWPITHAHMEALAGLPGEWEATLTFSECDWPLPHREYAKLATHTPTCFWKWNLGFTHSCIRRLQSIMVGVTERRARVECADRLLLTVKNAKAVGAMQKRGLVNEYVSVYFDENY